MFSTWLRWWFLLPIFITMGANAQTVSGKLYFSPDQDLYVRMEVKTTVSQQVMGKAISFEVDGLGLYNFHVLDTTGARPQLEHSPQRISFEFQGMGQKHSFDSDDSTDMAGRYGSSIRNILARKFKVVMNEYGTVLMTSPGKIDLVKTDDRLAIILSMIEDIPDMVYPPSEGEKSFFSVLPGKEVTIGESWSDSTVNIRGKIKNVYTLNAVTDSIIIVEVKTNTVTADKAIIMGSETVTTLNSTGTGKIIIDKKTGLLKEKKIITESSGTMQAMGGSTPVTSKSYLSIYVNPR